MEDKMFRNSVFAAAAAAALVLSTAALVQAAQYGTAEEARAMLDKAVAAVKADKTKALGMFNKGEGGFKDRDLYVFCANASDSIETAHPTHKGAKLKDIKDVKGFAFGEEIMRTATEGKVSEITYLWPRPGSKKPIEKVSFVTKVGDQICGVGYYK
jgi:signal transduction histidine kinase